MVGCYQKICLVKPVVEKADTKVIVKNVLIGIKEKKRKEMRRRTSMVAIDTDMTVPIIKTGLSLGEFSIKDLVAELKKRENFSLSNSFTPRELMKALHEIGYSGQLDFVQHVNISEL